MGRIMQTWTESRELLPIINFDNVENTITVNSDEAIIPYDEALKQGLVEVVQVDHFDGVPHVKITNNSSWKILIFSGNELIGNMRNRMVNISITLQHNAGVVIPAFFLASTYFFDQGMVSIQEYLHHFKVMDNQAGVVYIVNGKNCGERYGDFPLQVEVCYNHFNLV
ncbi:MAG: hypothetical protein KKA54_17190 [Proteobacteria bacterium]|nr:hypothetical protein [Pseudomonadota bacterium]